jgi:hypothetical protein
VLLAAASLALLLAAPPASPAAQPARSPVPGLRVATDGPPPAALADPRGPAPSADAVWIDGYWQWVEGRWSWTYGEWTVPPGRPPYAWTPARWVGDDRGFTFHEPYWRPTAGTPRDVRQAVPVARSTAPRPPPPLLVEAPGTPPSRDAVWIPGFWSWTGTRFTWVAGDWSAPLPGHRWVEGYWKRDGNGFSWVAGRWRKG